MRYEIFPPSQQLKDVVQCFWSLESSQDEIMPEKYFLMADSCAEIIFQYKGGFQSYPKYSARIRFQHSIYNEFLVDSELGFFGVRLYASAANKLLGGIPANEVTNCVFDLSDLFRQKGNDLVHQIFYAKSSSERISFLSDFLLTNTFSKKVDPVHHFFNQIIKSEGPLDMSFLQKQSGLSVKQFERRFKAIAGFTPKYFARVVRFQSAKRKYCSTAITSLTELAYECDYYDQSHFIREFREFSGVQPHHYFRFQKDAKKLSKPKQMASSPSKQRRYDGYLPCGWFV
jgi:AraC-like DNA-binding protein